MERKPLIPSKIEPGMFSCHIENKIVTKIQTICKECSPKDVV